MPAAATPRQTPSSPPPKRGVPRFGNLDGEVGNTRLRAGEAESARSAEPGERLSWLSSALPWCAVSENGVEDGQQLAGRSDEGDELWLSGGDQPVAEGFELGVVPGGDHG